MPDTLQATPAVRLGISFDESLRRFALESTEDKKESVLEEKNAVPFVKWVGGKRSIIHELIARLPRTFNDYYEPMVGGGALFFELYKHIKKAHLSDINLELMIAYKVIRDDHDGLITALKKHAKNHNEEYYYKVRKQHNLQDPVKVVARFLYLNKTCYNGLFRVNKKGEFNVPMGRYAMPNIIQEDNLIATSEVLKKATVKYKGFEEIKPKKGDFVYFDPPYHPTDETSFTKYTKLDFSEKDQEKLRDFFVKLDRDGVKVMLSNSNTKFIKSLYKKFYISTVHAPRFVNCKPTKRGAVEEVVITNYTS